MHSKKSINIESNSIKKLMKWWVIAGIAASSIAYVFNKDKPQESRSFALRPGGTIIELVRDSIQLDRVGYQTNNQLLNILAQQVMQDNNITDPTALYPWDTIIIDVAKLNKLSNERKPSDTSTIQPQTVQKTTLEITQRQAVWYTTINNIQDFKDSKDYLIQRLYSDKRTKKKITEYLKQGYKVKVPQQIENKKSPSFTIDAITKPDKILSNKLKGKKIVLDPGHGSMDVWAIWFAQYGDAQNKEMIAVYESPVVMDMTYRIAKLMRSHWAEVVFTHYYNKRPILDQKDLPPASRIFDNNGHEKFQDIRCGTDHTCQWDVFKAGSKRLGKRCKIANNTSNVTAYISIHADSYGEEEKILSIKHQPWKNQSKSLAEDIMANGFEYTYNGKKSNEVEHTVKAQNIQVLRENKNIALLVELWNMYNENQAYRLRDPNLRQDLAEKFVNAFIKSL